VHPADVRAHEAAVLPQCGQCFEEMQVSLVGQWVAEARSKLADQSLKICEYHGGNRSRNVDVVSSNDIIVTTYDPCE
jgi:SNF2 family DNA or RNA helicase